jgi:C-terminal processing protease CtpA/Prc
MRAGVCLQNVKFFASRFAFFTTEGNSKVENRGVAPDIDIEMEPAAWRQGRDTQLEKAVATGQAAGLSGLFQILHSQLNSRMEG